MKAAPQAQAKLLDLQVLDREIAGLKHDLAKLPIAAKLREMLAESEQLRTKTVTALSAKKDLVRALKQSEAEVEKVQERAKMQRERLDSGQMSPKEMERIQAELAQLATRQNDLEDDALDAMDAVERASEQLNKLESRSQSLASEIEKAQVQAQSESGILQTQLDDKQAQRNAITDAMPAELVSEYEACRRATGGIGAVEVQGVRSVGMELEFSVAELSRLETAAPDEVLISEDHEVILVRK